MKKISIYGAGMFGFALAKHFGDKFENNSDYEILSYDRNANVVENIKKMKSHPYHFPNITLNNKNNITNDVEELITDCDILFLVVPSQAVRDVARNIKRILPNNIIIVNTAKALECTTGKRLSQVLEEELDSIDIQYELAHLSGGTIALDLANGVPLGAEITCNNIDTCKLLQEVMTNKNLRVYINDDMIGVEYAGVFKNIIAILAGIVGGMNLPYGSETYLISRAANEAMSIAINLGASKNTFTMGSQAWCNDLWMSCTGNTRNRYFGELIGRGATPEEALNILEKQHQIAEGYNSAKLVPFLCREANFESHILRNIYEILFSNKNCNIAIDEIMEKELNKIHF